MQTVDHSQSIISVDNVSFSYDGTSVLRGVSLAIHRGDYLAIVGGNGSGKTTLLKLMLGLLKPTSGSITLFGKRVGEFTQWDKIGYVSQRSGAFDHSFPATAFEAVLMGRFGKRGIFNAITSEDRKQAARALVLVDMLEHKDRLIGELSGGQAQRVMIARALSAEPEIVILDEPTVGVEQSVKQEFYALLKKLNEKLELTVVLVTHDVEAVAHEAMHIACLDQTIFFHQSVESYLKSRNPAVHAHT